MQQTQQSRETGRREACLYHVRAGNTANTARHKAKVKSTHGSNGKKQAARVKRQGDGNDEEQFAMETYCTRVFSFSMSAEHGSSGRVAWFQCGGSTIALCATTLSRGIIA